MIEYEEILNIAPYSLNEEEKNKLLTDKLKEMTGYHMENCQLYGRVLNRLGYTRDKLNDIDSYYDLPFMPVGMFKELDLKSVPDEEIFKTMTSSGTTGQAVSKIYLDRKTAANQQKTLVKIVGDYTGSSRLPMLILDCPSVVKDRKKFSARGAGILGFSIFASDIKYAFDDDMNIDFEGIEEFMNKHQGKNILMFGFTFMIWQYFYKALKNSGKKLDISRGIMIHGGGWKKLKDEAVSPLEFNRCMNDVCNVEKVYDYYGMVEQTGCIYMECECGHLHASIFSDVITRRAKDFSVCDYGEKGIIQVVSMLPKSYPGHNLLTEDEGIVLGNDDCPCGRKGKYFKILGRIKNAEIRGCSDTFEKKVGKGQEMVEYKEIANKIEYLTGRVEVATGIDLDNILPDKPYNELVCDFLDDLSKKIRGSIEAKKYKDVLTFGFWCRRANILKLKEKFGRGNEDRCRIGRGMIFHIAPSNVPINFAYSFVFGLISGNGNIVRVSTKNFEQVPLLCNIINEVLQEDKYILLKNQNFIVKYQPDRDVNDYFSGICDGRIVWGGDATIKELRKSEIGSRCVEICFADRVSFGVLGASAAVNMNDKEIKDLAAGFYNDTYLMDQNACSTPHMLAWLKDCSEDEIKQAKEKFWSAVYEAAYVYELADIKVSDKYKLLWEKAAELSDFAEVKMYDNLLYVVDLEKVPESLDEIRGKFGLFYELTVSGVNELAKMVDNKVQTMVYCGINKDELKEFILNNHLKGIDRIVPFGSSLDIGTIWDGYDIVGMLSRVIG